MYLHQELGVALCRAHNICIPKDQIASHLHYRHKVTCTIPAEIFSMINDSSSKVIQDFYNNPINYAIPNITVFRDYFKCSSCPKMYSKKQNTNTHFKFAHAGQTPGEFIQSDCQTLFHYPSQLRYFAVIDEDSTFNLARKVQEDFSTEDSRNLPLVSHFVANADDYDIQMEDLHSNFDTVSDEFRKSEINIDSNHLHRNAIIEIASSSSNASMNPANYRTEGLVENRDRLKARIFKWFQNAGPV